MMRTTGSSAIYWLLLSLAVAAPLRSAGIDDILSRMEKASGSLKTYSAEFTKERVFVIAEERDEASGQFYYQKPGKILWQFQKPDPKTVHIEPGLVETYDPKIKQLMRAKPPQSKSEFQIIGFGSSKKSMTDTYVIELRGEDDAAYHLLLTPRSVEDSMFEKFELWVDKHTFVPSQIKLYEKSKDETTITFTGARINPELKSSLFKIVPPAGTEIIE